MQENGLTYQDIEEIKVANVKIVEKINDMYDYTFVCVRYDQLEEVLKNVSGRIVTMVNTIDSLPLNIIRCFPGAGGYIENGVLYASFTPQYIQRTTLEHNEELETMLKDSRIPYQIVKNMVNWQIAHLALVVPLADVYYKTFTPEKVYQSWILMKDVAKQLKSNFTIVKKKGVDISYKLILVSHLPTILLAFILRCVYRSRFAQQFMYPHSMNASSEMRLLHDTFYAHLSQ